jgi:uroporphyrinogen decarboxylase
MSQEAFAGSFPLKDPKPDFEALENVVLGRAEPERVHFVEEFADVEVIDYIVQNMMEEEFPSLDETWASAGSDSHLASKVETFLAGGEFKLIDGEPDEIRVKRDIAFYYRMGYDYLPDLAPWYLMCTLSAAVAAEQGLGGEIGSHAAPDTAGEDLTRGMRNWMEEKVGFVSCWEEFERIPWERVDLDMLGIDEYYRFVAKHLPDGMKVTALGTTFGPIVTTLGFETLCELLYEDPELVQAVSDKWGQLVLELYERMLPHECVGFAWQADDLGYKSKTLLSPSHIRQYILPWFSRYADLAHAHGKMFWLHSCGNIYAIMEDLIEDVGIDAQQSFQDQILPITDFMDTYGNRIAGLGGVDMDKLCRLEEPELRAYCRSILDHCMPKGRYAYGTGNTVANYIPLRNYLTMMEVGYRYRG